MFRQEFMWLFSLGLGLSSAGDILITVVLFFLLQGSRSKLPNLNLIIDALILYTFEIGSLTSVAAVATMICWIVLDQSLIFLGLHFVIGKLYANSLLARLDVVSKNYNHEYLNYKAFSLHARKDFRRFGPMNHDLPSNNSRWASPFQFFNESDSRTAESPGTQILVTKSVEYDSKV
ncbi:hypothetical protein JR316_0000187 [Psilocybe cubensis]|uniref:Uncharacterized protein n=2 Tax=Psilocybe cubensis TaxID=181762 RepID=A0ACB8HDM4_PSICU|nr:hypothetical protein JR316_0000187 [Psilocybe cubensis]KAH9486123.1 hypothetical protein JR316_0000187 [Psilocybe cubensis]